MYEWAQARSPRREYPRRARGGVHVPTVHPHRSDPPPPGGGRTSRGAAGRGVRSGPLARTELGRRRRLRGVRQPAREMAFLLDVIHTSKAELDRLGVQVRDVQEGLVDFPSQLGAEVVCLTWERGQDAITHYHPLSGDTDTRPLPGAVEDTRGPGGHPSA
ncbi:MAG: DUF2203 family protein [Deinococcales bacterium]